MEKDQTQNIRWCGYCGSTGVIGAEKFTQYCDQGHTPIYFHEAATYCPLCIEKKKYATTYDLLDRAVKELQKEE